MTGPDEMEVKTCRAQFDRLLREKQKFDLLLRFVNDGIILVDLKGDVVYANRPALDALGFSHELEQGFRISDADKIIKEKLHWSIQNILVRSKSSDTLQLGRNGQSWFFKVRVRVCTPSVGELGIFITLRDVTPEHKHDIMKDDFFNSSGYDIRVLFLGMQRLLEKLENSCSAMPEELKYIAALRSSQDRLFALVQNILDRAGTETAQEKQGAPVIPTRNF